VHPVFVPLVAETARYLSDMEEGSAQSTVDSVLELRRRRSTTTAVQAFDPQGERVLSLGESLTEQMLPLTQLGFYELRRSGTTELVAVNPDPRESNLRPMEADTLAMWKATGREHESTQQAVAGDPGLKPPPIRIWRLLLALLVLAVLIESVLGNWHLKVQREV
jgi:alkylated DNA repair dioxygenase AlkB